VLHRRGMRRISIILIMLLAVSSVAATEYRYSFGLGGGPVSLSGGDFFSFGSDNSINFSLGHRLSPSWQLDIEYASFSLVNDTLALLTDSVDVLYNNSPLEFKATRLGLRADRKLFNPERFLNLTVGLGGGLLIWKGVNPESNTTYEVRGDKNETTDFSASELYLSGGVGILIRPSQRLSLQLLAQADYLTGAGAEFAAAVSDVRDKLALGASAKLYFHFGSLDRTEWKSEETWKGATEKPAESRQPRRDSDGDGIEDASDNCLNTPRGAEVDSMGCPIDSDRDGVPDGLDDCPNTQFSARLTVDIHGCPVDSDFDNVPDFADSCPFGPLGAQVNEKGCPIDTDNDGVPEGLDDCPNTLPGVAVDQHGCIDLTMLSKPMVLNIDYEPGSFEVDPHSRARIERLAGLLNFVPDIRLDINGYTDDIGNEGANRSLSEKRANRVKGILVSLGVAPERIKAYGKGEADFVASNQTAVGRAKNRRIEIVFYK
jgi:outer membrane protein OmpA-like peptidoglycan-associated protein